MRDRIIAFVGGDVLAMVALLPAEDVFRVVILGFIGGFVGLAGKEFYHFLAKKIIKICRK